MGRPSAAGDAVRRGEVRWGNPPIPASVRKRRPFLVVSDDAFNLSLKWPKVMVVHLTTVDRSGGPYPWEVELPRGTAGLPQRSIAKCGEVYTLFKEDLGGLLGTLPHEYMKSVDQALAVALSLPRTPGT